MDTLAKGGDRPAGDSSATGIEGRFPRGHGKLRQKQAEIGGRADSVAAEAEEAAEDRDEDEEPPEIDPAEKQQKKGEQQGTFGCRASRALSTAAIDAFLLEQRDCRCRGR